MKKYLLSLVFFFPTLIFAQQLYHGGVVPQDLSKVEWFEPAAPHALRKTATPASVDNSAHIPPVLDQGGQNSCLAFALGYYYRTYQEWQINGTDVTDPLHQFSPTFMYNMLNGGGNNPTWPGDAAKLLIDHGIATLSDCPFTVGDIVTWPTEAQFTNALTHRWSKAHYITVNDDAGVLQIKDHLAAGNVAVLLINIWDNLYALNASANDYTVSGKTGNSHGAHAVTIVGYDDAHATGDGAGAFKCVNSWGTGWGAAGYFWMSYAAVKDAALSQRQAMYGDARVGYTPSIIAKVKMTHNARRTLDFTVGAGTYDPGSAYNKYFLVFQSNAYLGHVNQAMPANNLVLDLTDISYQFKNNASNNFYFVVHDAETDGITGTIDHLEISVPSFGASVTAGGMPVGVADDNTAAVINLTVNNASGKSLVLTSPAASGGTLRGNSTNAVTWTSSGVANVKLEYSINAGAEWNVIANSLSAGSGSYTWSVPDFTNNATLLKISDAGEPAFCDANIVNVWKPTATTVAYNGGYSILAFPQGSIEMVYTNGGSCTVTYYPYEAPSAGALPSGVFSVAPFYWTISTEKSYDYAGVYLTKAQLKAGLDFTKTTILARAVPGGAWTDLGQGGGSSGPEIYSDLMGAGLAGATEFTIGSKNAGYVLPVELVSFTAQPGGGSVLLKWKTETEVNSYGFEIERCDKQTGRRNADWQKIGFIKSAGSANAPSSYAYTDTQIKSARYLYRLKMIDNDGAFKYSDAVEALIGAPQTYSLLQNYPNPFNPSTVIDYSLPEAGHVTLQLYSVTGQLVQTVVNEQQPAGFYSVKLSGSSLVSGMYFYRLTVNNRSFVKRMILMK